MDKGESSKIFVVRRFDGTENIKEMPKTKIGEYLEGVLIFL